MVIFIGGGWLLLAAIFFRKGLIYMSGDEFVEVWLLVALAVLFIDLVVMYLMIKTGEKIHEERIKKIKEKEQV